MHPELGKESLSTPPEQAKVREILRGFCLNQQKEGFYS